MTPYLTQQVFEWLQPNSHCLHYSSNWLQMDPRRDSVMSPCDQNPLNHYVTNEKKHIFLCVKEPHCAKSINMQWFLHCIANGRWGRGY